VKSDFGFEIAIGVNLELVAGLGSKAVAWVGASGLTFRMKTDSVGSPAA
jgi:hypothetical protein